ncbi:Oxygen-dependent choline dehydrogenase-like protein [Cladobotryum mycophilum]|uniref:Oxygen-dependent choline dehydrogenase-like protein n=1 Tax=Cladobotryum mycophilum TaxID=491253 RepID=A0ABR0SR19_9HYPO
MASETSQVYDFIVVGAGPAGSALATQLAKTTQAPSVLLIEAGSDNSNAWGYESNPDAHMDNRVLPLARGKGLGGSSAVNFTVWSEGAKADWDRMVTLTGDGSWAWDKVKQRYNKLTTHHCTYPDVEKERQRYIHQKEGNYGTSGPIHIGYSQEPEEEVLSMLDIWEQNGVPVRPDPNDGNLLGFSVYPATAWRGVRTTSADLLYDAPDNLDIITDTPIRRVILENGQAVGIESLDGRIFKASKEFILSAGAMDSPKILMHSGIGPEDQLSRFSIPVAHANPNVGQNFQDHVAAIMRYQREEHTTVMPAFFKSKAAQKAALRQWEMHRTGPLATIGCTLPLGFVRSDDLLNSPEFASLPEEEKAFLSQPDVASYEIGFGLPDFGFFMDPDNTPATFCVFLDLQYLQSRGSFTLKSSDPSVPLSFETNYLSHPYDRRQAIESTRYILKLLSSKDISKDTIAAIDAPASDSEEDILAWWRKSASTSWHMSATCKLGKDEVKDKAVVDPDFRVHGVKGLRVVDNSIWPFLPAAHVQAHAYQLGLIAAEKLAEEYGLAKAVNGVNGVNGGH